MKHKATILITAILLIANNAVLADEADDRLFQEATAYWTGTDGRQRDQARAIEICRRLAAKGHWNARLALARTYVRGSGTMPADCEKGFDLMKRLADDGCPEACADMAVMLREGTCSPVDTALSWKYDRLAADKGHVQAMYNVGMYLRDGLGGQEPDTISALGWFRRAAEAEYPMAQWQLSRYYHEIGNAEEARYWLRRGADNGCGLCVHGIGLSYLDGINGFPVDKEMALRYFVKGADDFDLTDSMREAGKLYLDRGNKEHARAYLRSAAGRDDIEAIVRLADSYINDDDRLAYTWYQRGADLPVKPDTYHLNMYAYVRAGLCFYLGKGVMADTRKGAGMIYNLYDMGFPTAVEYVKSLDIPRP